MSTAQCGHYGLVKERILQACEMAPDAYMYHQKLRNLVKQGEQTRVVFAREKAFDRWLSSMNFDDYDTKNDHDMTKTVGFSGGVQTWKRAEIMVHLDEQMITDLKSAAVLADAYAMTH